jgi:drug/metabolite transporter (DMT)-like permease
MDRESKMFFALILVFSTLLGGAGQLLFKAGLESAGLYIAVYLFFGLILYGISTLAYFYTLSRRSLSWAYSFGGLSYIFASVFAYAFLAEPVSPLRWIGILVIAIGTAVIGLS